MMPPCERCDCRHMATCGGQADRALCSGPIRARAERGKYESARNPPPRPLPSVAVPEVGVRAVPPWEFVAEAALVRDTSRLLGMIPEDVDFVVGVARSGMLPASILAYRLHLPLWGVSRHSGVSNLGHGWRLESRGWVEPRHVLVVDDTVSSGREIADGAARVRAHFPEARVTTACVYCKPESLGAVDRFAAVYPGMHYLEWNWQNAGHGARCGFDIDGIIVRDGHPEVPLYPPRRQPCPLIATGRHESSRDYTEAVLSRLGVRWERLAMFPERFGPDAIPHAEIAAFKAEEYRRSDCVLFAESEPSQAEIIYRLTGRPVLCPAMGLVLTPGVH